MSVKKEKQEEQKDTGRRRAASPSASVKGKKSAPGEEKSESRRAPRSSEPSRSTEKVMRDPRDSSRMVHQLMPYMLVVLAVFIVACFILSALSVDTKQGVGILGEGLRNLLCGLFGWAAFLIPAILIYTAFVWRKCVEEGNLLSKNIFALLMLLMMSAMIHVCIVGAGDGPVGVAWALYKEGYQLKGGGLIGGTLGEIFYQLFGLVGSLILTIAISLILLIFYIGFTPAYVYTAIKYNMKVRAEQREEMKFAKREKQEELEMTYRAKREAQEAERARREAEREERERERAERLEAERLEKEEKKEQKEKEKEDKSRMTTANALDFLEPAPEAKKESEEEPMGVIIIPEEDKELATPATVEEPTDQDLLDTVYHPGEEGKKETDESNVFDLNTVFGKNGTAKKALAAPPADVAAELGVTMTEISDIEILPDDGEDEDVVVPEAPATYAYPTIDLLAEDTSPKQEDAKEELVANAQRLMETLKSFNVRIKEITYSRGPTITRYELKPDTGIRVRSIANLVDDIALSLATGGVRIEAPIPNKPAVGIEVPNKNPATVFLRSLIEAPDFGEKKSKLTATLGKDVAGSPVYFDIGKMPHLLIAGTTGSGKSVCINSIILSLLYKASPEEVKLILVDPKKVEFSIYKDIPHLYAPIVSDPKKAAGALASAVAEMERRFELIEEVGVRDIAGYNAIIEGDPEKEFMPYMVIIIDELADLMMTAKDAVETSICRLAQKARAAGMHIIIGTQRPSVDVITGLIKANVPSRIAFAVASQTDSRTMIDIGGAEKLIGRGDMLYMPVGALKPARIQGAFVSDAEVERVVEFVKKNNRRVQYNEAFMSALEKEAQKLDEGKRGGGGGGYDSISGGDDSDEGGDNKFRDAVLVAIEMNKVSTSLLQRKLEIGYGRAAKLIDRMQEMGYVSAPDGNKPRQVLITKQEFMEKVINNDME